MLNALNIWDEFRQGNNPHILVSKRDLKLSRNDIGEK